MKRSHSHSPPSRPIFNRNVPGGCGDFAKEEEDRHTTHVIASLEAYSQHALQKASRYEGQFFQLSDHHNSLLLESSIILQDKIDLLKRGIHKNQIFIQKLVSTFEQLDDKGDTQNTKPLNIEHPRSLLKQFARDWSVEVKTADQIVNKWCREGIGF